MPHYDLWSPAARANPFPVYERLREHRIVRLVDPRYRAPLWIVPRYADAVDLLRDPRLTKDVRKLGFPAGGGVSALGQQMLMTDPPDHTRLRGIVGKAFTPRRVDEMRPRIEQIARSLLDAAPAEADLLDALAFPLPMTVIAEMLGIPDEDRAQFREWTQALVSGASGETRDHTAAMRFAAYLWQFVEQHREAPADDLTTALVEAEEQGDRLSTPELVGMVFLLLVAGHETTVNLIANGALALMTHPDQLARLRDDRSLLPYAVDEMLRFCGPVETSTARYTTEPTEIAGTVVPRGQEVVAGLLSADHDPAQFPEPETFDVGRTPNRHVAFGYGIHYCLGAPLARLEAAIAFDRLLDRAPNLSLAVAPSALRWRPGILVRGVERLPVRLG